MKSAAPRGGGDPVRLEIFRQLFLSICEEMGLTLMRTGHSPNIKERRDYSCAVFDSAGRTIAQGDHMPVHLGSMPASVEAALGAFAHGSGDRSRKDASGGRARARGRPGGALRRGDVVLLNDPFRGGTHLPDLTMVAPFFAGGRDARPLFYLANRAHHSDVGGMSAGSMPLATEIWQEGLILPPVRIVRSGKIEADLLNVLLANCRTPAEREGDLRAQLASLRTGDARLREILRRFGRAEVSGAARRLQEYSRRSVEAMLRRIPAGTWSFEDRLDGDGTGRGHIRLAVTLTVRGGKAVVDLRRVAGQVEGGVNAVASITASAVSYVFRCLLETGIPGADRQSTGGSTDVPWNSGGMDPIRILLARGSVLAARAPAAVAGGNVETSQRVVDLLQGAFARALRGRIPAASQGTMNNVSLGGRWNGAPFAYYETVGGGMGAGPAGPGASGVHTHMTNSLNTPIEAIESALPIVVEATTLRRGSGGAGRHRGGDGTRRELRVLVPVSASLLTERRDSRPWGLEGGGPGAAGRNTLRRAGGALEPLPDKGNFLLEPGDHLVIETPGGGGWGGADPVRAARRRLRTGMESWPAGPGTPGRDPR